MGWFNDLLEDDMLGMIVLRGGLWLILGAIGAVIAFPPLILILPIAFVIGYKIRKKAKAKQKQKDLDKEAQRFGYRDSEEAIKIMEEAENEEARALGYRDAEEWEKAKLLEQEVREEVRKEALDMEAQARGHKNYEQWQEAQRLQEQQARRQRLIEEERARIRQGN